MLLSLLGSFATTFLAKALTEIVGDLWSKWRAEQDAKTLGAAEAVAAGQAAAATNTRIAHEVETTAAAAHRADASDAAFDQEFKRP